MRFSIAIHLVFSIVPMKYRILNFGSKLQKLSRAVLFKNFDELYLSLVSHFADPSKLVIGGSEPQTILSKSDFGKKLRTTEHMMALDLLTYLPDDILVKVDRAAMSCSFKTRVPFLDNRLSPMRGVCLLMKNCGISYKATVEVGAI